MTTDDVAVPDSDRLAGVSTVRAGTGTGPALVLAHGAGGSIPANFGRVIEALGSERTLLGANYPGTEGSALGAAPLTLDGLADTLIAVADAAGVDRFPILGMSLGSAVAVTAAHRYPDRVTGLLLTVGLGHADAQLRSVVSAWRALAAVGDTDALAALILSAGSSPATLAQLDPAAETVARQQISAGFEPGGPAQAELVAGVDIRPLLAGIAVPTVVMAAGQDRLVLPSTTRDLAAGIPGAELIEYPDAGHIFTDDEERRWIGDIRGFLTAQAL
ncbi:alpha/beta fold hydrolase [Nakamurella aerolata]|uniref:alpha/beta fold hydrolase n=1 Tax=Nakamurella aerolata TaxID=1656892 RepID=UPI001BB2A7B8